nr:hypothetical protein CFP56_71271 [Quercus suber]
MVDDRKSAAVPLLLYLGRATFHSLRLVCDLLSSLLDKSLQDNVLESVPKMAETLHREPDKFMCSQHQHNYRYWWRKKELDS